MMKKDVIIRGMCLLLVVFMAGMTAWPAAGKTKNKKAKEAKLEYKRLLMRGNTNWCGWFDIFNEDEEDSEGNSFGLIDMDKNGVPELIVTGDGMYHSYFYTYVKKKTKKIGYGFSGSVKFYPNKKLVYNRTIHSGSDRTVYSKFNGKKLVEKAKRIVVEEFGEENVGIIRTSKYYVKNKRVDKQKYKRYVKKLRKNAKRKKLKLHKAKWSCYNKYLSNLDGVWVDGK